MTSKPFKTYRAFCPHKEWQLKPYCDSDGGCPCFIGLACTMGGRVKMKLEDE